jgi:argininosuccinate lyase
MSKKERSWEKRLSGEPNKLMIDFVESLSFDRRLYQHDIAGSIAHAQMLAQQRIITQSEFRAIKSALNHICKEISQGSFVFDRADEDIHMAIEKALIERVGAAGEKLHTGRSRNDQVATDMRLWMRDQIARVQAQLTALQGALVQLARDYAEDIMPAYTHFQRAQPISISAYLLSFVEQLERDRTRLDNCSRLLNISPLGSGAVAGSTLGIDRKSTAQALEFSSVTGNSIDAVSDRDFCAEFIFNCAMIGMHLSRLAEDWIIYSSSEFRFVRIDDSLCTSSSMMPQKRNPDVLELVRGKTGSVYGSLVAMLTLLKAQPSGYNRDLQEDKVHVFSASDTVEACLGITEAVVSHTRFNTQHIAQGLDRGFLDATALAEYLVIKGIPFRQAHGIVGSLVASCEAQDRPLEAIPLEDFQSFSPAIDEDVYQYLGPKKVATRYATQGAAGVRQAKKQISSWQRRLAKR